jgi:hypothetical protein
VQIKNVSFASLVYEEVLLEVKRTAIDNQDISGLQIWVAILAVKIIQKAYPKQNDLLKSQTIERFCCRFEMRPYSAQRDAGYCHAGGRRYLVMLRRSNRQKSLDSSGSRPE